MWELGDVLDLSCCGRKVDCGARRWRSTQSHEKRGREHTPLVTLRRIGNGHCEELVLRQKHSVHVVAEAHLTVVRAMVRGSKSRCASAEMRKCRDEG
eukprot:scaffold48398_cov67-Phaeocystis_antarctica.AAC.5